MAYSIAVVAFSMWHSLGYKHGLMVYSMGTTGSRIDGLRDGIHSDRVGWLSSVETKDTMLGSTDSND